VIPAVEQLGRLGMLKAIRQGLAWVWRRPRRRTGEHRFHDQREAQRFRDQGEASGSQSEQYGSSGSGF
jgi:hypothetical protein